ncbi:putative ferric-chelate reductase 1, partial [Seriola dumerili]|uniref:putative ferric-chelate reductase 1 n=1 Tax=Seriola dumerili TaxID=41447 RepID=UPI000BBED72C
QLQALGSTPFTGFLLQAREVGGQSPVGSFTLTSGATQLLTCSQRPWLRFVRQNIKGRAVVSIEEQSDQNCFSLPPVNYPEFLHSEEQRLKNSYYSGLLMEPPSRQSPSATAGSASSSHTDNITKVTSALTEEIQDISRPQDPYREAVDNGAPSRCIRDPCASFVQNFRTFWEKISRVDCGVTKVCFSQPSDCDPAVSADCYFMSAMMLSPSDAAVRYELTGPSDGYVSFGFSDDQMMGNDDIYICGVGSDGLVRLQRVFSTGRTTPQAVPLGNVSELTVSAEDRVISCSFTSMNSISTQRSNGLKNSYYLLFAHGPSSRGQIQFHTATFISTDKVHISRPQTIREAGRPPIIRAHGALMLTAWMTAGSLGMMVARYLRGMAQGQTLWGKDVWFLVHVAVMSVTTAATVIAFILPFSHVQTWSEGAHPVFGCLVMSFSFFQPILALLRCGPQHPLRFLFYWSHVLNALVIKALAVAAIFTGLKLIDSSLDQWLMKVMGGFISWEVLFFILMEVHITADLLLVVLFLLGNISFLVALLVGIGTS